MSELSQDDYQNVSNDFEININNEKNQQREKMSHNSRFLLQLYKILEKEEYKNIIHWGDNGKYFIIENIHDFTENILPKYYNHNNYSSFVRQLNMYDFHKKKTNTNGHSFQQDKFIKGKKELIKTIRRKKRKDKNHNIISLIPLNTKFAKYNYYNDNSNFNLSDNNHSLYIDEEKDNYQFNNGLENALIEYKNNNVLKNINEQLATIKLKQNLLVPNYNNKINDGTISINNDNENININHSNIVDNKKITKKNIYDSLNSLLVNIQYNTKSQKQLNNKMDLLYNRNLEYINKNKAILDEIESKVDYNKKFESVVHFILEIQKIKKEGALKNILISNDINNNQIIDNSNDLNNLEILNLAEQKKEKNGLISSNSFLKKKTYNNGTNDTVEPFESFLNKYMDKNKNIGLLTNEETIKNKSNNILNNKNDTEKKDENIESKQESRIKDLNINNSILKDNYFDNKENRRSSFDISSSIFNRKRSSSFNSLFSSYSNNINDICNNDFIFKKSLDTNSKNNNTIFGNNNQNIDSFNIGNNSLNKSFDIDFNQNNYERKDSLNNSFLSNFDIGNKTDKLGDIFGGDNSINFN